MSVNSSRKIKALHIASFLGNIGDVANHQGFYKKLRENISIEFSQIEIRNFYKNRAELKFDNDFIAEINRYDLLILGGGGFFDLQWDYSHTGTTIDFSPEFIDKIKIPVIVNAMGYHEYEEVKGENIQKFQKFLEKIITNEKWLISVRNDGSFSRLKKRYGDLVNNIIKVPDHGFFYSPKKHSRFSLTDQKTIWIGVNITNDLFNRNFNKDLTIEEFNSLVVQAINTIYEEINDCKIILFAHAHQDVTTLGQIIQEIEDKYRRERLVVAPFFNGGEAVDYIFDLYRICSCVVGMRFHANVCSIGMNIPTIGLAGHAQIAGLYNELGIGNRCINLDNVKFKEELVPRIKESLLNVEGIRNEYLGINHKLNKEADFYHKKIKKFVSSNIL